jgi:hypothetical protein
MDNEKKVKQAAFRVAFLMPHQFVGSIIELEASVLEQVNPCVEVTLNKESPEYLAGANDALKYLIQFLKEKGH